MVLIAIAERDSTGSTIAATAMPAAASSAATAKGREVVTLSVPSSMRGGGLSAPHQLEVPKGWSARAAGHGPRAAFGEQRRTDLPRDRRQGRIEHGGGEAGALGPGPLVG